MTENNTDLLGKTRSNNESSDCQSEECREKVESTSITESQSLSLVKKSQTEIDLDPKRSKKLRFGIDVILKEHGTFNRNLPFRCSETQPNFKTEQALSQDGIDKEDLDISDGERSDVNVDTDVEENDVASRSSLSLFGLHPQLSVLVRSQNNTAVGANLNFFPPSLQLGSVGLQWPSVNDVRKDRFGCKY